MKRGNLFTQVQLKAPQTNTFDLTHDVKFSAKMGNLTPVLCTDLVPGDRFTIGADVLVRFAPLVAPVMHRFNVTIHYFFVPNRILWPNWEKFITRNGTIEAPYLDLGSGPFNPTAPQQRFMDYMGVPPTTGSHKINALPFAAFQKIYNDYYRDQNLQTDIGEAISLRDGAQDIDRWNLLVQPRLRAWEHDYFTSSLPFAQKGADVDIPLGEVQLASDWQTKPAPDFRKNNGDIATDGTANFNEGNLTDGADTGVYFDPNGTLEVGSTTINNLRRAFRLQEFLEKMARGGSRYVETILSFFGVRSSDRRLQRPEYITGVKTPIVISEVLNTAGQVLPDGDEGTPLPQGNMAGHAVSVGSGMSGSYFAEEHGWIIGILSVMPRTAYMQGLPKRFSKLDPLEHYWPPFAHLGEQEVLNKEIFIDSPDGGNGVFGYVPRYAEYKYEPSRVAGDFRTTLDYWHLARKFATQPVLNEEFISCDPSELDRIFAVQDGQDNLFCHVLNRVQARRPMPVFGTPML